MKNLISTFVFIIALSTGLFAQPEHTEFGKLLRKHVSYEGGVRYAGLIKDKKKLEDYLSELSKDAPQKTWTKNEKKAYWINTYNAIVLLTMCKNYPLENVYKLDEGQFFKDKVFKANQTTYSLDDIEHNILRPLDDARIHCAINCAAKSSPILNNFAYEAVALDNQLDFSAKRYVKLVVMKNFDGKTLALPKVFDWYKDDFKNPVGFINRFAETPLPENLTTFFAEYDWSLNNADEIVVSQNKKK
jgi:hypothetical protein